MKRLPTIFVAQLALGGLAFWMPGMAPLAAQQKEPQTVGATATQQDGQTAIISASPKELKVMREYRGVKLGMKRDEVRDALGKPELSDKVQDSFKIGDDDRLTAHYDNDSVKAIQLYFFESKKVPTWADVVGDTKIEQRPDGSKVTQVDVPEENFSVSMYQSKSGALTTITISRSSTGAPN
jgi:hypothetical protein